MGAGLSGHISYTVAADHVSAQEVAGSKCEYHLRPAGDVETTVSYLEWEIPNYAAVRLLTFVRVLGNSGLVAL